MFSCGDFDSGFGHRRNLDDAPVRILLVSQMYPSAAAPDFGVFVQGLERSSRRADTSSSASCSTGAAAGSSGTLRLAARASRGARRFRPDVVYAHFLFPTGLRAARSSGVRAPLVVTAHGQDVAT